MSQNYGIFVTPPNSKFSLRVFSSGTKISDRSARERGQTGRKYSVLELLQGSQRSLNGFYLDGGVGKFLSFESHYSLGSIRHKPLVG